MELTIEQALQQGVVAHKEGRLEEAERLYRAILQSQPFHPDANHNLGLIAVSVNKAGAALPLFKTAIEANPKIEQFWLSYIDALVKEEQFEEAKKVIEQAKNQGFAEEKLSTLALQIKSVTQEENADNASPSDQQISTLLGCYQTGQYGKAEQLALSITQQFPKHQFGWKVLGALFVQSKRYSEALNANKTSVALSPKDAAAHYNLGSTLKELNSLKEAEVSLKNMLDLSPDLLKPTSIWAIR